MLVNMQSFFVSKKIMFLLIVFIYKLSTFEMYYFKVKLYLIHIHHAFTYYYVIPILVCISVKCASADQHSISFARL